MKTISVAKRNKLEKLLAEIKELEEKVSYKKIDVDRGKAYATRSCGILEKLQARIKRKKK